MAVHAQSGFPRVEISVDGERYGFLVDTGAAYTMISREVLEKLVAAHADWPRLTGAVAEANMIGNEMDTDALLVRISRMNLGSLPLANVGAISRRLGIFETSRFLTLLTQTREPHSRFPLATAPPRTSPSSMFLCLRWGLHGC